MRQSGFRGRFNVSVARTRSAKANILANAGCKDCYVLWNNSNAGAYSNRIGFRQRHTVHQHRTCLWIVIAHHQREDRAFTCT
ncbi:hypothetical protein D3C81_2065360 [compost metagenome]